MKNIPYEDAVKLLLDSREYKDYVLGKNNTLIGGEVGKEQVLENLLRHKNELQIPSDNFFKVGLICFGITYIENYEDNRNQKMFIPVDYNKLLSYLKVNKIVSLNT